MAIVFCVKDVNSPHSSSFGQYISRDYIGKQVERVIPEYY